MSTNKKEICLKHQLILLTRNLIGIGYKKKFKISRPTITIWSLIQQLRTLKSEELANSLKIRKFESKFASKHGANFHAVAINSGTNAIFVILKYLKLNKDDEVIVPSFNFIAAANAVIMAGGKVNFVDVDPSTLLIDFDKLEKSISSRTKAVVIVHLFGRNVDLDLIKKFIKKYPDIQVIEDCAQSLGSEYADGQLSGTVGLASAFSFYPSKNITTGEGGMVLSNNTNLIDFVKVFINQGMSSRYNYISVGLNLRMSALNASLGLEQLNNLNSFIKKRRLIASIYIDQINKDILSKNVLMVIGHSYNSFTLLCPSNQIRDELSKRLEKSGIETRIFYPSSLTEVKHFEIESLNNVSTVDFRVTKDLTKRVLQIPIYPKLSKFDAYYISQIINSHYESLK